MLTSPVTPLTSTTTSQRLSNQRLPSKYVSNTLNQSISIIQTRCESDMAAAKALRDGVGEPQMNFKQDFKVRFKHYHNMF
jgi:hypothetical protein